MQIKSEAFVERDGLQKLLFLFNDMEMSDPVLVEAKVEHTSIPLARLNLQYTSLRAIMPPSSFKNDTSLIDN